MAFYLKFERRDTGEDLYPLTASASMKKAASRRITVCATKCSGGSVISSPNPASTSANMCPGSSKHSAPDLIGEFNIPLDEYIERCKAGIIGWQLLEKAEADGRIPTRDEILHALRDVNTDGKEWTVRSITSLNEVVRSVEYGSQIIHSMETGEAQTIYGNVANDGIIDNLPEGCCVEVPCLVDANGIQPTRVGEIPPHLAALMADQYQCAVAHGRGGAERQARAYLPRGHAGPAHGRRVDAGPDLVNGGRVDRGARGLSARLPVALLPPSHSIVSLLDAAARRSRCRDRHAHNHFPRR